ncbi:hypothetical protein HZS_3552 [Henneguya salminicola]|uniref:Cytoplasmic tRNA 2-thiolation protein 1 (Trinotate prediction) n=1 Tax=Henneguya salminicola TaxID=69463 RepID=A0A6G3ML60_HENSL|nr:hypothetical protein HZS_3552 [Henneguya salminicola]
MYSGHIGLILFNLPQSDGLTLPRCKPLIHCYQKEIVLYAKYTKLDYFATECIYSSFAYRFYRNVKHRESARTFIKDLESVNPLSILSKPITFYMFDIVKAAEQFESVSSVKKQILYSCEKCGFDTSQKICQACVLVETLQLQQEKATKMGLSSLRSHQRKL